MISPASIQEVMNRADVVDVIGQFVRLKKRGANYIANCPFHNEKSPSFSVSAAKGIYKCFGCGKAGNVVTFVQDHEKLTYPEAIRWLADYYKITIEETERTPEQQEKQLVEEGLRILNEYAAQHFHDTMMNTEEGQNIGLSYFKHRGFSQETIDKFRLGYNPETGDAFFRAATLKGHNPELMEKAGLVKNRDGRHYDSYRGRVIFPIQSMTGRILGFGARILKSNDRAPKYINTPENELYIKSRVLYGMYQSRNAIGKLDECFLVEGYTDVVSLHQGGVENVVASSGTSLTEDQLRLIGQLTKNLTILYDGDSAGIKAALRGLDMALSQSFNVQLVLLPDGEDPDSYIQKSGANKFYTFVKENKKDVIGFRLEIGMKDVGTDPVKKSKLVNEIAESISKINKAEDFSLQTHYIREASTKLKVEESGLVNLVNKYIRERVEQSERNHRRDTPVLPEPEYYSPADELPELQQKSADDTVEWHLIRVLIEHGAKPFEGYANVADLIHQRVDPNLIEGPLVRQIYDSYYNFKAAYHKEPDMQYFINFPDAEVQQKIATLLQSNEDISENWSKNYGIESMHGELNYTYDAESTLTYFEIKKMKAMQVMLMDKITSEQDPVKQGLWMKKYMELKSAETEILKRSGTAILGIKK